MTHPDLTTRKPMAPCTAPADKAVVNLMQVLAFNMLCCLVLTVLLVATGAGWIWGMFGGATGAAVLTLGSAALIVLLDDRVEARDTAYRKTLIAEWEQDRTTDAAVARELRSLTANSGTQRSA